MKRLPSIKRLARDLRIDGYKARLVRELMEGTLNPEVFESVQKWVKQCHHRPSVNELIMCAINEVLECHGVEGLRIEGAHVDNFHYDIVASYCNTGDTYATTVLLNSYTGCFEITSYGDFVERYESSKRSA